MLLLVIGLNINAQQRSQITEPQWTSITSHSPESFCTQLISSTENSIKVNVQVPGFYTINVTTPQGEANVITVPKSVSTAQAGEPNVPMTGIPIMIGDRARMNARVIDAQYKDFENIEVAPSKGDFPRTIDPETVPYTYGECYSKDAFFPASNLGLYEPYIIRDFRGQNMAVYPFAYNSVSKTLRVYYNMTVELYKVDDNGKNVMPARKSNTVKLDPDFKSVYQRHFINYEAGMAKYTPVDEEGDLLIICHDNFISAMTDFVNWKKTRGVNTTIVGTSTAGSTASNIKSYIQSQYNANNNLTHVLLVGDVAQIPGYSYSGGGSDYSGLGDNAYGQIVGNDIYNDLFIGRFSASTAARVATQCNRTITYERDLTTSATWLNIGEGIARKEGQSPSGHNNEDDYVHMNNIRTDLLGYGYSTVYQRYANLSGYTATSSQISSDINSGVGIINYCNHGQETAWGANSSSYVYYAVSHVNALTNENKLPFIFSVACLVGKYDHSSDCFAEAWMNATNNNNPTGAIGTLMSYIEQPWEPPMWAQDECIDILVESYESKIKHTWGGTSINGIMAMFDHYNTSNQAAVGTYQAWILYGDPSLMLRTKTPTEMTVTHNGIFTLGTSSYSVNVSNGDGAVATITDVNHNILGKATVNNGTALIPINSTNLNVGDELTLCVFGFNKVTKINTITVEVGTQYNITCNPAEHGTISAPAQAYPYTTVTLTATPETDYLLASWTVNDGNDNPVAVTNNTFVMPESNVTVSATFAQGQYITMAPATNGSISADPTYALEGTTINLTATPDAGYVFDYWVAYKTGDMNTSVTVSGDSFPMPDYDVTVVGVFMAYTVNVETIGSGTDNSKFIPTYNYYNYSLSQQIYTATEVGEAGTITAIAFEVSNSKSATRNIDIYLSHTSTNSFSNNSSWIVQSTSYCVFSGDVEFLASGWTTITLDTPFEYDGVSNLLLTVDDNTGSCVSSSSDASSFYVYSADANTALYKYLDGTNFDPASMTTGGILLSKKNQLLLTKVFYGPTGGQTFTKSIGAYNENDGWYLIASPVDGAISVWEVGNLINTTTPANYDLYRFNQDEELEWQNFKAHFGDSENTFNALVNGQGYLYANAEDVMLSFTGTINDASTKTVALDEGWNLVGNPFTVNACIDHDDFYVMNDDHDEIVVDTVDVIAPMEGVFVYAENEYDEVTFSTQAPGKGQSFKPKPKQIVLNLSRPSTGSGTGSASLVIDRAIVRMGEGRTLPKFQINRNSTKIYLPQNGRDYAIAYAEGQNEMPLNFEPSENGIYTITVNPEGVEMAHLHLIDNLTGADVDLLVPEPVEGPASYTFTAKTTDYASRFRLVFAPVCEDANGDDAFAFISNGNIVINGMGTLQVIDGTGRIVWVGDAINRVSTNGMTAGVYVLRLINGDDVKTQKIVVR